MLCSFVTHSFLKLMSDKPFETAKHAKIACLAVIFIVIAGVANFACPQLTSFILHLHHDKIPSMTHADQIATQLNVKPSQVTAVINLLDEGNTVPFIARYRKEMTGSLDDEQIRIIADELIRLRGLDERRVTILASIEEQGKLTDELRDAINAAVTMTALEDLYAPYKKKRRTRAMVAREKGLEPLADLILKQGSGSPEELAAKFLNEQVTNIEEALQGARDIVAETISDNANVRAVTREKALKFGKVRVEKIADAADEKACTNPIMNSEGNVNRLQPHQILAHHPRRKGRRPARACGCPRTRLARRHSSRIRAGHHQPFADQLELAIQDSAERLLLPAIERDVRREKGESADNHAIQVFATNLRALLGQLRWRVTPSSVSTQVSAQAAKSPWLTPPANCSTPARSIRTNRRTTGRARSTPCKT